MWRNPANRDEHMQAKISRATRKINRKTFLNHFAQKTAELLARAFLSPEESLVPGSLTARPCHPPNGQYCSGCGVDASCPSDYIVCTPSTVITDCKGLCPYPSGWWYTSDPVGQRAKCQDCISRYVHPSFGKQGCYRGAHIYGRYIICACRSTMLY